MRTESRVIRIAAAVLVDSSGRVLLVRKRDTTTWMQPGGKIEPGEHPADTIVRELREELGLELDRSTFDYWGRFAADAANEAGHTVDAECYFVVSDAPVAVQAEIEELLWIRLPADAALPVAPLSSDILFPLLAARA